MENWKLTFSIFVTAHNGTKWAELEYLSRKENTNLNQGNNCYTYLL